MVLSIGYSWDKLWQKIWQLEEWFYLKTVSWVFKHKPFTVHKNIMRSLLSLILKDSCLKEMKILIRLCLLEEARETVLDNIWPKSNASLHWVNFWRVLNLRWMNNSWCILLCCTCQRIMILLSAKDFKEKWTERTNKLTDKLRNWLI